MKGDSPAKKHHFWILFGIVPLFTLIAALMVSSSVGGKIAAKQDDIKKANAEISGKMNPKPEKLLRDLDKTIETVTKQQGNLHKENWLRQQASEWGPVKADGKRDRIFTWPRNSSIAKEIELRDLKFGDAIPAGDLSALFSDFQQVNTYQHEYSSLKKDGSGVGTGMADRMAPTQFKNGWQSVLRYVNDFGAVTITKDQTWLIMEDMWVQRSALEGVRAVNEEMSILERVKYERNGTVIDDPGKGGTSNPRKRLFRNRTWELALEVVQEGNSLRLTGQLANISTRLQLLGNNNTMKVNVWLSNKPGEQPFVFKIGGEYLPGRGSKKILKNKDGVDQEVDASVLNIVPTDDHILPQGYRLDAIEIARVEQVFDARTVPIKRIDALVIGQLDSRNAKAQLTLPSFIKETPPADGTGTGGTQPGGPPGLGSVGSGGLPGGGGGPGAPPGPPGLPGGTPGGDTGGVTATRGGGPLATVADGNKKRYLEATEQVRRLPIGIVLVVDQAYIQDVLLSYANSPLRFQITQVTWTRFRSTLDGVSGNSGTASGPGSDIDFGRGGTVNFGNSDPDGPRPPTGGSGFGPRPPMGPVGLPPAGGFGVPPGFGPGFGGPGFGGNAPATISDSQVTAGLVELSIYGIVSIYEKPPEPPKPEGTTPEPPKTPTPNTPTPPMPMTPEPPKNPKMRRRVVTRA